MTVEIPDRENLESMSRTDIQKLCKDNNIKANMRTDEMINALCDLVNGKEVPRPHRSMSERATSQPPPKSRLPSQSAVQPPTSKPAETSSTKKAALQPSESNTDAESVADTPAPAPTTRRKAKDIQTHLGKGRPVVAGGSGARNVTKTVSRGSGRKAKASTMLREDPIPEEDEESGNAAVDLKEEPSEANKEPTRLSSVRTFSPTRSVPSGSHDRQPSQLPTPAPSQPSYTLPSVQLSALETRITHLETSNLVTRMLQIEASMTELSTLKASVTQIPVLQAQVKHLEDANKAMEAEVAQWSKMHTGLQTRSTELEAHVAELFVENGALKERIVQLEAKLIPHDDASMTSVVIHSPKDQSPEEIPTQKDMSSVAPTVVATIVKQMVATHPSPSQPTLGKRTRSETPDVSDATNGGTGKQRQDSELEAIHRVTRPLRKKARLELDPDEDTPPFPLFDRGGPSSTSTPRHRRSESPPGFFSAGRRAPTPLTRRDDMEAYLQLDPEDSVLDNATALDSNVVAQPHNSPGTGPVDVAPKTPPPSKPPVPPSVDPSTHIGSSTLSEQARLHDNALHDPGYFGASPPVFYPQGSELPYPLHPSTPPNTQDIYNQSAQFATPTLGEPWKYSGTVNPANISHPSESMGLRVPGPVTPGVSYAPTGGLQHTSASSLTPVPPGSPLSYTFRAGGRRERNDKYNPYFTPQRGPNPRHRTGLTPTRGFSLSLKSPATMTTLAEGAETNPLELDEDGVERSPPQLRTMYGTELEGDTRFGDYGRDLGRFDWGKYVPR